MTELIHLLTPHLKKFENFHDQFWQFTFTRIVSQEALERPCLCIRRQRPRESVRERAQITDLFAPTELRKVGREFLSRCPWHQDRRRSLTVSPQRNQVHCFVCGKGTMAIGWLQDRQNLSFHEAVLELARRTGVSAAADDPVAQRRSEDEWKQRRQLQGQRKEQRDQFHQALLKEIEQDGVGADYLQKKGISHETARTWQLGVALDWLNNLAVLAVDGAIDGMALQLSAQLPGAVGAVLAQAAAPGPEVIAVLKRELHAELQALLEALEPVDGGIPMLAVESRAGDAAVD